MGALWRHLEHAQNRHATRVFGIRFNLLLSAVLCVGSAVWFVRLGRRTAEDPAELGDASVMAGDETVS
jgi:hypothetical protein